MTTNSKFPMTPLVKQYTTTLSDGFVWHYDPHSDNTYPWSVWSGLASRHTFPRLVKRFLHGEQLALNSTDLYKIAGVVRQWETDHRLVTRRRIYQSGRYKWMIDRDEPKYRAYTRVVDDNDIRRGKLVCPRVVDKLDSTDVDAILSLHEYPYEISTNRGQTWTPTKVVV